MSARTFGACFESLDDCLLGLYRACSEELAEELHSACDGIDELPEKVRAAVRAALSFAARRPVAARFVAADVLAFDDELAAAQAASIERLAARLADAQGRARTADGSPPLAVRILVAGVVSVAAEWLPPAGGTSWLAWRTSWWRCCWRPVAARACAWGHSDSRLPAEIRTPAPGSAALPL